jgi:hypothetical protein
MSTFANQMVFYVKQGQSFDDIYRLTKSSLLTKNEKDQERSQQQSLIRRSSSFMMMSQSCSTLNFSQQSARSIDSLNSANFSGSNSSLSGSSSKNNQMLALRENFMVQSGEKSAKKFSGSDSNLNKSKSSSSSNLLKAKRQISF